MYNERLKEEFIETYNSEATKAVLRRIFSNTEKYEMKMEADVCTFKKEDLKLVVSGLVSLRKTSRTAKYIYLKSYCEWCCKNNVDNACLDIYEIDISDPEFVLSKVLQETVSCPQQLEKFLDVICPPIEDETQDCIYRCYLWLAYSGLKLSEAIEVLKSEVDFIRMIIKHNGKEYPIYPESLATFYSCVSLKVFKRPHPRFPENFIYKERGISDKLLVGYYDTISHKAIGVGLSNRIKRSREKLIEESTEEMNLNLRLRYRSVWLSGVFYRTYQAELQGIPADFMPVAIQRMEENGGYSLKNTNSTEKSILMEKARYYAADYEDWKSAYKL